MSKHLKLSLILAVTSLGLAAPLHAQGRSTVSSAELDAAVAPRPMATRPAAGEAAATDQVRKAAPAEAGKRVLAGGSSTIVISTTAVIIGLLILILLTR